MDLPHGKSIPVVQDDEFKRLLGLPPDYELTENMVNLSQWARDWYAKNGQPWIYSHEVENFEINEDHLIIDSYPLYTKEFRKRLVSGRAHSVILVAVAGALAFFADFRRETLTTLRSLNARFQSRSDALEE